MAFCPNINSSEYKEIEKEVGSQLAHVFWNSNKGNPIDKAPNGKDSKLFKDLLDITDRSTAIKLKINTHLFHFKSWFGDSKVIDINGEPLIVYHSTTKDFNEFDKNKQKEGCKLGKAFYFTINKAESEFYSDVEGNITMPVFLSIKELKNVKLKEGKIQKEVTILLPNEGAAIETNNKVVEYAVSEPTQIKSVYNKGIFSPLTGNIYNNILKVSEKEEAVSTKEQIINDIFNGNIENSSFSKVVNNLLESDYFTEDIKEIITLLKDKKFNGNIEFTSLPSNIFMQTNGITISINKDKFDQKSPKLFAESLVHEVIHSYTSKVLDNPSTEEEVRFSNQIKSLYRQAKNQVSIDAYGLENEHEFMSEIISNSEFRKELENKGNLFQKFINFLTRLITGKNIIKDSIGVVKELIEKDIRVTEKTTPKNKILDQAKSLENVLDDILKNTINRAKYYKLRGKEGLAKKEETLYSQLLAHYKESSYLTGISKFIQTSAEYFEDINKRVIEVKDQVEQAEEGSIQSIAFVLKDLGNYSYSTVNIMKEIRGSLKESNLETEESKETAQELIKLLNILIVDSESLKEDYIKFSRHLFAKFLQPMGWTKSLEDLERVLKEPVQDISWKNTWLDSLAESTDDILKLIDVAVKRAKDIARETTLDQSKDLIDAKKELEKRGIKTVDWLAEVDSKGLPTGYFITEYNWGEYDNKRREFFNKLQASIKKSTGYSSYQELIKGDAAKAESYKREVRDFYKTYTISEEYNTESFNEVLNTKKKELSEREFEIWQAFNIRYNEEEDHRYILTAFLKNNEFQKISKNKLKRGFYNKITELKYELDSSLPLQFRHSRRLPQIRKDFIERIKTGDIKNTLDNIQESFIIKEDETEYGADFGIKDERGNVVNFIPIHYVDKLSRPKDLSLDIVATVSAYADMANNRMELSKIIDTLELGADVVEHRGVVKTGVTGKTLKAITKAKHKTYEDPVVSKSPGNIFERLQGYYDMQLYGKLKEKGARIPLLGIDSEKLLDLMGRWTAFGNLALNLPAGISNVGIARITRRVEAASKRFFSQGDINYADKVYTKNLGGTISDIGARAARNKMSLWIEKNDVLENAKDTIYNLDVERKNIFSKLLKSSSLFFIMTAGEHYAHTTTSLALANSYRYYNGKWIFKKEFFKEVQDLKDQQRAEIKAIEGSNSSQKVKSIKRTYEGKIKALNTKLEAKWNTLTNYWNAHEVVNKRLVPKKGFNITVDDKIKFINRTNSINHSLHGIYNQSDRAMLQRKAYGRLAFMYRKWIPPAFNRRFQKAGYNYELQESIEGYYRTSGRFLLGLIQDLKEGQTSILKHWESLSDLEKANFRAMLSEVAHFTAVTALAIVLTNLKGDDDDDWALNMMAYQANRLFTELGALTPTPFMLTEGLRLVRNPIAAANLTQEVINFMQFWQWGETIERGKYKDWNKFEKGAVRIIPPFKTIHDLFYPEERLKFYMFNGS